MADIRSVPAIDFHSHFGAYHCAAGEYYAASFETGDIPSLLRTMSQANIAVSINSHSYGMIPRGRGDALRGNEKMMEVLDQLKGVYAWAVVNPKTPETFDQAAQMLKHPKVLGIKVHPEEHQYPILQYGDAIYSFAAEHHAVIITHSGEENSMPEDFCTFANRYPTVKTIVSHLGCGYDGSYEHQMRAIEQNTRNNLFTDTSSASSMMANLIEYAINRLGSERILFGTDSSFYFSPSQRARIDFANISDADKENILYRNALRIFPELREIYRRETGQNSPHADKK